jgi:hypothetical protein
VYTATGQKSKDSVTCSMPLSDGLNIASQVLHLSSLHCPVLCLPYLRFAGQALHSSSLGTCTGQPKLSCRCGAACAVR